MNRTKDKVLSLWPGVGLVMANMIGAGVFLSTGFMAQDMGPGAILLAWLVGLTLAMAGAKAYAALAELVPRSGGEYRYLSELLHPALGYLAGWASLLVGFSAPVAVDALAAGGFAQRLAPGIDPRWVAVGLILALTALHVLGLRSSARTQNLLVAVKVALVVAFAAIGLVLGSHRWPGWSPPQGSAGFPAKAFLGSLFYIAFAFSGWNAAIYAAEEFQQPKRDVPRAMLIGCALVGFLYLVVNWVFVANLTPVQAAAVFNYESSRVTLGHVLVEGMVGGRGAAIMSAMTIVVFASAISAMTFAGPRVYAAMARDGFLPRAFVGREGRPPALSIVLQCGLAIVLVLTHRLQQVLQNVGAILVLFSGLSVLGLFRARFGRPDFSKPRLGSLAAAAVYSASAAWMLYFGFRDSADLLGWVAGVAVVALVAYGLTVAARRAQGAAAGEKVQERPSE